MSRLTPYSFNMGTILESGPEKSNLLNAPYSENPNQFHLLVNKERLISIYELKNKSQSTSNEIFLVVRDKFGKFVYKGQFIEDLISQEELREQAQQIKKLEEKAVRQDIGSNSKKTESYSETSYKTDKNTFL